LASLFVRNPFGRVFSSFVWSCSRRLLPSLSLLQIHETVLSWLRCHTSVRFNYSRADSLCLWLQSALCLMLAPIFLFYLSLSLGRHCSKQGVQDCWQVFDLDRGPRLPCDRLRRTSESTLVGFFLDETLEGKWNGLSSGNAYASRIYFEPEARSSIYNFALAQSSKPFV
jgi:hypothetical protein